MCIHSFSTNKFIWTLILIAKIFLQFKFDTIHRTDKIKTKNTVLFRTLFVNEPFKSKNRHLKNFWIIWIVKGIPVVYNIRIYIYKDEEIRENHDERGNEEGEK